jgi:hypothetical protein
VQSVIIYPPEISSADGEICIAAHFELQTAVAALPNILWYKFPAHYGIPTSGRMDAFVASLLLLAMLYGEDIEVRGKLSPRLAYGLGEYQRIFHAWLPERFKLIGIHCEGYNIPSGPTSTGAVACAFSGGVDSFYTLWSHLSTKDLRLGYQISHALFIHGYDIFLADTATYRTALRSYACKMQELGIELVTARTNIYEIVTPTVSWEWAHGAALIGVALVLDRLFARFLFLHLTPITIPSHGAPMHGSITSCRLNPWR